MWVAWLSWSKCGYAIHTKKLASIASIGASRCLRQKIAPEVNEMTRAETHSLAAGFAPVIAEHVHAEIHKANVKFATEISALKAELAELRAKLDEERQPPSKSSVRRVV
jgi:hypothetical protein